METKLIKELIRAKMINAKRAKEAYMNLEMHENASSVMAKNSQHSYWEGQEIAFKQLLDILES